MKIISTIIFLVLMVRTVFGQELDGTYFYGNETLKFKEGKIEFKVNNNSCLSWDIKGSGTYEYFDNYLLIKTSYYEGEKSTYRSVPSTQDSAKLIITDIYGKGIPYVNLIFMDSLGKAIGYESTDYFGSEPLQYFQGIKKMKIRRLFNRKLILDYKPNKLQNFQSVKKIKIGLLGYSNCILDYKPNTNFYVTLVDGEIIENQFVVFLVDSMTSSTISLNLLSTNFQSKKNKLKELHKLKKEKYCDYKTREYKK